MQALCLIAERLAQLHGSGWVHRDLKPGNVLRLPGQHSWTLMDFGCAALAGRLLCNLLKYMLEKKVSHVILDRTCLKLWLLPFTLLYMT